MSQGTVAGKFQNLGYTYDNVGNITDLKNHTAIPPADSFGGLTAQHFDYDDLYRLTSASGNYQFSPDKTHSHIRIAPDRSAPSPPSKRISPA